MPTRNLLSVYQSAEALQSIGVPQKSIEQIIPMKEHEVKCLHAFCDMMIQYWLDISCFDGYYVGYKIPQIGKEFDLLRFGERSVINIELKSNIDLNDPERKEKVLAQLSKNFYYLHALNRDVLIFIYIVGDGLYKYNAGSNDVEKIKPWDLSACIRVQTVDLSLNPDDEFSPSKYLVSPFNATDRFIHNQYFLTDDQQRKKSAIIEAISTGDYLFFTISAHAGTGKSLLIYDIAKELMAEGQSVLVFHCGILNEGHTRLIGKCGWNIKEIKTVNRYTVDSTLNGCQFIIIDEAQRIRHHQLKDIIDYCVENRIPILFSYDTKQYLKTGETTDIYEYLAQHYPNEHILPQTLTTRIRTNQELSSFVTNLFNIGKSNYHTDYSCISIDYFQDGTLLKSFLWFLGRSGWKVITFTNAQYGKDPLDYLASLSETNAHNVIGQDFSKVAVVLDTNFEYRGNKLYGRSGYYSASGMLYQIVTRVIDKLKIIVFQNPQLYQKLQEIKMIGNNSEKDSLSVDLE